jgi:hypothetical protein
MITLFRKKEETSTDFSRFIRDASSSEKKRVFKRVLKKATQDQIKIITEAEKLSL